MKISNNIFINDNHELNKYFIRYLLKCVNDNRQFDGIDKQPFIIDFAYNLLLNKTNSLDFKYNSRYADSCFIYFNLIHIAILVYDTTISVKIETSDSTVILLPCFKIFEDTVNMKEWTVEEFINLEGCKYRVYKTTIK